MVDSTVCYILSKDISESFVKGCLLNLCDRKQKLYMLHCPNPLSQVQPRKIYEGAIPLKVDDFEHLIKIAKPEDRFDVFTRKLEWGKKLCVGSNTYVKLRNGKFSQAVVKFHNTTKLGMKFGVEIAEEQYKGCGDDKVYNNLFTCAEKCGLFVDLDRLELEDPSLPHAVAIQGQPQKDPQLIQADADDGRRIKSSQENDLAKPAEEELDVRGRQSATEERIARVEDELQKDPQLMQAAAGGRTENKLRQRINSSEKNDMAKLAVAELELQNIKGELSATKEKIAHMEGEKVKVDQEKMELQAKLLDAMEKVAQMQGEKLAAEQSKEDAERKIAELEDTVKNKDIELDKLHCQFQLEKNEIEKHHKGYINELREHYQDQHRVLQQENRALSSQWEVDQNVIENISHKPIGSGGWGTIHKGKYKGALVAVKKLYPHIVSEYNEGIIRREIRILSEVRHPNILQFLGAVISKCKGESSLLMTELLDTDLRSAYEEGRIHEESKVPILCDVASALVYLHTRSDPIIHRDVSSANVLLQALQGHQKWRAKLSDFGSANVIAKSITPNAGAAIYAAPEIASEYKQQQTDKVDVYSFGVLVCEVVLLSPPPDEREDFFTLMLSRVYQSRENFYKLAKQCTKRSSPKDRPCMLDVLKMLSSFTK